MIETFTTAQGREIALEAVPAHADDTRPGVVFLGGFKSDMEGSKALFLKEWCAERGLGFTRFDYSGHGQSGGAFEDGAIGDWYADALAVIGRRGGRHVLVGSSMGGWISLLVARDRPDLVAGLVTIAAAPDFTQRMITEEFTADQLATLKETGRVAIPSDYGDPYVITQRLIDDGATRQVLTSPLDLPFPVRMVQGTADAAVPQSVAGRLIDHVTGPDIRLTLVKGADHRFSDAECLALIGQSVADVLARL